MKQRWCWTAPRLKSTNMPVELKKGISRGNGAEQGRFDDESPCGNGWAWESIALFALQREPQWHLYGTGFAGAVWSERQADFGRQGGYDRDKFVHWIEERGGIVVIPSRICAKRPRNTDWHTYKERHLVENLFLKLKNYRRFATRYEKKALYFHAVVSLACILVWLLWWF